MSEAGAPSPPDTGDPFRDVYAVLMAGGIGTRFWPLSTPDRPKQFLTELTERSLFEQAVERARALVPPKRILIMTGAKYEHFVRAQAPEVPVANIVCEPLRRDTAAAIICAARVVAHRDPEGLMIVTPSDHLVRDTGAYRRTMAAAVARAREGGLGTIGIPPARPATGFGYLEPVGPPQPPEPQPLERFVEKPDHETATRYIESGRYLWNAGMFIWRARTLLEEAARHLPETCRFLERMTPDTNADDFDARAREAFEPITPVSIDFGVMEKAAGVWTVPALFDWDDVGGWWAAEALIEAEEGGNRRVGRVELQDAKDVLVVGPPGHPVLVAGLEGCVVVHAEGGTLVCSKAAAETIKPLVKRILAGEDTSEPEADGP